MLFPKKKDKSIFKVTNFDLKFYFSFTRKKNKNRVGYPFQKNRHIFLVHVRLTEKT